MSQSEKVHDANSVTRRTACALRAEKRSALARVGHAERKRDTRRKILIGGAVLAAIDHEGVPTMRPLPSS